MTQRLLVKLDMLKKYTMKRLAKYEKVESPSLGKVQLSPFVKIPLMVELKLDYELSPFGRSWDHPSSFDWPKSVSAAHKARKKPSLRPFSAPKNLQAKESDKKGKLQTLDGGFVILKLNRKVKPLHFTAEVQKRPERILYIFFDMCKYSHPNNQDESKILDRIDTSHHRLPAAARTHDGQSTVAMEKGERTDQSSVQEEISNQDAQQVEKDSKVRFAHLLPYNPNTSKDIPLEETLMPEEEEIRKSTVGSRHHALKEKSFIPLSIEDEIEKQNAKIIRVDLPKAKPLSSMKMSETHPVLCNKEEYLQKFIVDKYIKQNGDKEFCDTCVVFRHLNPILQNNYNETLTILQSPHFASRVKTKKKRKPTSFSKPQILSAEISSGEKKGCTPMHSQSQIEKPAGQKIPGSFTNANRPIMKEALEEKYVSQPIHKDNENEFVVCGVNLKTDEYHEIVPANEISGTSSQVLVSLDKSILPVAVVPKKRVVFVDYIPISKPVKMCTYGDKLSYQDSSLPVNNYSAKNDFTEGKAIRKDRTDINQDASDKKVFLNKTSLDRMDFSEYRHPFSFEEGSEISNTTVSTLSSKGFEIEASTSFKILETEQQPIISSPSRVISIPTAQCDASESNRDLSVQKITGH